MKTFFQKYLSLVVSTIVMLVVTLFWLLIHPEALNYQEQYQLWLFDIDYLYGNLSQMGGFADFIGEFMVQWYRIEWLGALLLGGVYGLICFLITKIASFLVNEGDNILSSLLGVCVSILLLWHMGDESVLMSYPVALIISMSMFLVTKKFNILFDIVIIPIMYWLIGPVVWIYAILRCIYKYVWNILWIPVYVMAVQVLTFHFFMPQWSLQSALCGIGYYRTPMTVPSLQIIIPVVICLGLLGYRLLRSNDSLFLRISLGLITLILSWFAYDKGYDSAMYELMRQDYLVRNERWNDVLERAAKVTIHANFWSECVNLSLGMTNQLADKQFEYYQSGQDALIMPMMRDITSNMPSMEAFYHLGMINECMRYAFDMQECIPNGKKSGRLSQRIVECCIINGKYSVARKHIELLKKSVFYREWAKDAERYLGNEKMIEGHTVWGKARELRYKVNILYYYPQIDTMFADLFATNTNNRMALEYCIAQNLLNGNADEFMKHLSWAQQYGGYSDMPRSYQDAYNCIAAQGNVVGSLYGEYVQRMQNSQTDNEIVQGETH